jgi:hypothetical protein
MSWNENLAAYLERRNEALRKLDVSFIAETMPSVRPELYLMILHKARYSCVQIEQELRHESGKWLLERGYGAMSGPILPNGELPK